MYVTKGKVEGKINVFKRDQKKKGEEEGQNELQFQVETCKCKKRCTMNGQVAERYIQYPSIYNHFQSR